MAANGMSRYLLRLTNVYYTTTMMMVRAGGDEEIPFVIRSNVCQVCALSTLHFN